MARLLSRQPTASVRFPLASLRAGHFLLLAQEKVIGPQGCGTNTHGRGSVFAKEAVLALQRAALQEEKKNGARGRSALTLPSPAGGRGETWIACGRSTRRRCLPHCDRLSQRPTPPRRPRRHPRDPIPVPPAPRDTLETFTRGRVATLARLCESIPRLALSRAMRRAALHARRGGATVDPSTLLYAGACARRPWPASSKP